MSKQREVEIFERMDREAAQWNKGARMRRKNEALEARSSVLYPQASLSVPKRPITQRTHEKHS